MKRVFESTYLVLMNFSWLKLLLVVVLGIVLVFLIPMLVGIPLPPA